MKFNKLYKLFCEYYQDDGSNDEIMKSRIEKAFLMYAQNQGQTSPIHNVGKSVNYDCEAFRIESKSAVDFCGKCGKSIL